MRREPMAVGVQVAGGVEADRAHGRMMRLNADALVSDSGRELVHYGPCERSDLQTLN